MAGANAGKLLGAPDLDDDQMEEDEEEEEEDDFDIAEFQPVDNNLCSVLGEQVEFSKLEMGKVRAIYFLKLFKP